MSILALIPARSGSKGIKNKNILPVAGRSILDYSISDAKSTSNIDRVVVTTDCEEIASIAKESGAEVPFLRPKELSADASSDRDYIDHALTWLEENEGYQPSHICLMRPTTPLRDPAVLEESINKILDSKEASSLRSVHALAEPPQKMLQIVEGWLEGFFPEDKRPDYFNLPRQCFPTAYQPNGYVDILTRKFLEADPVRIFGDKMLGFETPYSIELDTMDDLQQLKWVLEKKDSA